MEVLLLAKDASYTWGALTYPHHRHHHHHRHRHDHHRHHHYRHHHAERSLYIKVRYRGDCTAVSYREIEPNIKVKSRRYMDTYISWDLAK